MSFDELIPTMVLTVIMITVASIIYILATSLF